MKTELTKEYYNDEYSKFAKVMGENGDWKTAEQLEIKMIEIRKKVLCDEHPDTLAGMGYLANTYWKQGRWSKAEQLQVQLIEIGKKVLGDEHPDTLSIMENLAITY